MFGLQEALANDLRCLCLTNDLRDPNQPCEGCEACVTVSEISGALILLLKH